MTAIRPPRPPEARRPARVPALARGLATGLTAAAALTAESLAAPLAYKDSTTLKLTYSPPWSTADLNRAVTSRDGFGLSVNWIETSSGGSTESNSDDGGGGLHSHACRPGLGQQLGCHLLAQVGHRDLSAGTGQGQGIAIGRVVVGGNHGSPARQHAIAVDIGADGAAEHDPRPVVAGKHQRPLQGAAGHHNGLCSHDVQTLAWHTTARVGGAGRGTLDHAHRVAVVKAKGRGPRQQPHPAAGFEFSEGVT